MKSKIRNIDEGLRYLYLAKTECRVNLYGQIKMGVFRFLLGHAAAAVMLFRGKHHKVKETFRRIPWRALAYVACVSCAACIVRRLFRHIRIRV